MARVCIEPFPEWAPPLDGPRSRVHACRAYGGHACRAVLLSDAGMWIKLKRVAGGFSFDVEPKKHDSRVKAAQQRKRDQGAFVKTSEGGADRPAIGDKGDAVGVMQEAGHEKRKRNVEDRKYRDKEGDCGACA